MRKIIFFILLIYTSNIVAVNKKSPHGEKFNIDCTTCHVTENWQKIKPGFDHNKTKFPLRGQHTNVKCKACHTDLDFSKAPSDCNACHTDVHQGTTGNDCARCHNTNSWIVTKIKSLHQEVGFPLRGSHQTADCNRCHTSASSLRFENIKTDCYACHKDKYLSTIGKHYDHQALGFDTDCARCHNMIGMNWNSIGKGFDHGFFPLTGGHNLDCNECHIDGNYKKRLSSDCVSCHGGKKVQAAAVFPAHNTIYARYSCGECHTNQTWNTVKFKQHDAWWGIYSGNHKGKWVRCIDCHTNDAGYDAKNTCNRCHKDKHF